MALQKNLHTISLFTGAGGLDIGLEKAGFSARLCVEVDEVARATLKNNRPKWKLAEPGDVHDLSPQVALEQAGLNPGELALLAGGPPCQPFSKSSYWVTGDSGRMKDPRSGTLKAYLELVEYALPATILLENVKGLTYSGKDEGLQLLTKGLRDINNRTGTNYVPHILHINAAQFGVPQFRERVFLIAHCEGKAFRAPAPTHGQNSDEDSEKLQPYRTAWDAIGDLEESYHEDLKVTGKWADLLPSIIEGNNYQWHTPEGGGMPLFGRRTRFWSFLLKLAKNQPSWTIQAQPGSATGPFHWKNRKLSIREICRLQTFPDDYQIMGSYREGHRQIGNAVPCAIGELLGLEIRRQFFGQRPRRSLRLIPEIRGGCPPPEIPTAVPEKYKWLRGEHAQHPGVGLGPGARKRVKVA